MVNLSRKPVTRNNVHDHENRDGGCWGQEASRSSGWVRDHDPAEDTRRLGTCRKGPGLPYQNKDVYRPKRWNGLKSRGELCQHGEAWARRDRALTTQKSSSLHGAWWDLAPQFRSWDVPPDDGGSAPSARASSASDSIGDEVARHGAARGA